MRGLFAGFPDAFAKLQEELQAREAECGERGTYWRNQIGAVLEFLSQMPQCVPTSQPRFIQTEAGRVIGVRGGRDCAEKVRIMLLSRRTVTGESEPAVTRVRRLPDARKYAMHCAVLERVSAFFGVEVEGWWVNRYGAGTAVELRSELKT